MNVVKVLEAKPSLWSLEGGTNVKGEGVDIFWNTTWKKGELAAAIEEDDVGKVQNLIRGGFDVKRKRL